MITLVRMRVSALAMVAVALIACDDDPETTPTATWHETLRPVVETQCVGCHQPGGIGPFSMTYDEAEWADGAPEWAASAVAAVEAGTMPPWPPDPTCREYKGQRVLSEDERAAFAAWRDADFAEGDPSAFAATQQPQLADLGPPDLELAMDEGYAPDVSRPDDYRCLPLPRTFEKDTWVNGTDFLPDRTEMVHHVVVFVVEPGDVREMEALDADEEGLGYTCFGDSGIDTAKFLAVWAPGVQPSRTPEGSALLVPAGGRLIMQMHYNVLNLAGQAPEPDRTQLRLWTLPDGETPAHRISLVPHADIFLNIPAGEAIVNEAMFDVTGDAEIVGVAPHEHLLGASIRVDLVRDGEPDDCLVDIPSWDFNWQDMYYFRDDETLTVGRGDRLRVTCGYDNSVGAQPVVNGERLPPRDVAWGDGSLDEMCLNFLVVRTPFEAPYNECALVPECEAGCEPGDSGCWVRCLIAGGADCAACTLNNWLGCAAAVCSDEIGDLITCAAEGCESGVCLIDECAPDADRLHACSADHMRGGGCNNSFAACGFEL